MKNVADYRGWLIFNLLPDIGRSRFNALVRHFGSPDAALEASDHELGEVENIGPLTIGSIRRWRELADVEEEMRRVEQNGVSLCSLDDPEYPVNLKKMHAPPPLIYYKGTIEPCDEAAVAVIGSRKMSRYGHEASEVITTELAQAGVTIVSGLALGIDSAAHRSALENHARTLAVLGNGLSHVYPASHSRLAEQIVERGALISEMSMDAQPDEGSFPKRNSIIAGLSLGVVVVEAGRKSGTQITAGYALEENRTVYAVPGDITRVASMGTNQLIKEGARLVTCGKDILSDLYAPLKEILKDLAPMDPDALPAPAPLPADLGKVETGIMELLDTDSVSIDEIMEKIADEATGPGDILSSLLTLELRGLVRQEPGKRFRRTR